MADQDDAAGLLFSSCVFTFVESRDLPEGLIAELSSQVTKFGGQVIDARRDRSLHLEKVTHIVTNTVDFPQCTDAAAMMIPLVKSSWISASLARNKPAQLRPYSPDPKLFFSEIILSVADDIPPTDKESIIGATMAMGGVDSENVTKLVTHICALSMDNDKCRIVKAKNLKCKIVLPHWFDDCFKLGKKIDEGPYLLPDPEIISARPEAEVPVPTSQHLEGATSARPQWIPPPTDSVAGVRPKLTVFDEKAVMLSRDLSITNRLREIIQDLIEDGGGSITDTVSESDYFVCQYRDGDQYIRASHEGKHVGNLSWLYHLITNNEWTSPMRRLLHYPVPRDGIPGFKDLRITVSNYGGEARIYLENLVSAAGATYTKTMKADNTHLITARNNSEKCEAARDWNINMINHLWIEESYAKSEIQSLTVERYTHFPGRTNLGEVIGQTSLDESKLRATYYPGGPGKPTAAASRKRKMLDMAKENAHSEGPAEGVAIGRQARKEFDVMKDTDSDYAERTAEEFGVPAPAKRRAIQTVSTPARGRHVRGGKENETPSSVSSGSRSAKEKAQKRLLDLAPDVALYEKEKKRGLKDGMWGGKRAADHIDRENLNRRSASSPAADEGEDVPVKKRAPRKTKPTLPEIDAKVILTGFKRWVNDKFKEDADRKKLRDLGIKVVTDGQECDYLVAPQVVRTVKFLRNLSKGAKVLSSEWIEKCLDTGEVPPPEDYLLKDKENEKKFGFKLQTSVQRAAKNKGKLLWNLPIYCTSSIKNGTDSYKAIADANGAIFLVYAARSGTTIKPTNPEEDEGGPEPVYLLSTASPEEKKLWPRFEAMARQGNMEPRVVASDWLLDVVMKQELAFDKKYLVTNFFS
ncbi:BRCA1 C terminus domain-containing protein [Seiridium cupressi]